MEEETLEIPEHTTVCFCPLHGILDTISKKWALMIIAVIGNSGYAANSKTRLFLDSVAILKPDHVCRARRRRINCKTTLKQER